MLNRTLITLIVLVVIFFVTFYVLKLYKTSNLLFDKEEKNVDVVLQKTIDDYESYISESLCRTGVPGAAVTIVKDENIVYIQGFGVRDIHTNKLIDSHTIFRLASVSKCFTAYLTGLLVQDSLLTWEDPVVQHLKDFSLYSLHETQQLTLKHLLSHTTGLPYHAYTNLIEEGEILDTLIKKLSRVKLISPVGTIYSYQNVAFSVVGKIIESVQQQPLQQVMTSRVFEPLHMDEASMSYDKLLASDNVALPHLKRRGKWRNIAVSSNYYNTPAAGGVNASILDMAKWLQSITGNATRLLSKTTLNQIFSPVVRAKPKNRHFNRWQRVKESYYALGWRILHFDQDTIAYHGGYVNGYRSELAILRDENIAICILANGPGSFANLAIPSFMKIYDRHRQTKR